MLNFLSYLSLRVRANKYKTKNDKGGISYILNQVKSGDTVLDVGAHKAGYLYFMLKRVGNSGQVHAFEPQNNLFRLLMNLKASLKWDNVFISNSALSDCKSKVTLNIPVSGSKTDSPGASILKLEHIKQQTIAQDTNTETLDDYCKRNNIEPSFIKIDVEGNELKVLKGGLLTINTFGPKIMVESEERHIGRDSVKEVLAFLIDLGYSAFFIKDNEYISINQFDFDTHQNINIKPYCNNFIFERNELPIQNLEAS